MAPLTAQYGRDTLSVSVVSLSSERGFDNASGALLLFAATYDAAKFGAFLAAASSCSLIAF